MKKIVVAYSGGLDTSVMIKWLAENYNYEIITVTGFLGQRKEIEGLEEKAYLTGASKVYIQDLREEFINNYAWKALKAGALYEGKYPLATAIGRPLLAKLMVDVAEKEHAELIAHGCTGKGNDQVRFEVGIRTLNPSLEIIAPLRFWEFKSREDEIEYAIKNKIPIHIKKNNPFSIDENLWGIAIECGELEDPENPVPENAYQWTLNPKEANNNGDIITIGFDKGIPISLNGKDLNSVELISTLNNIGSLNGIGRMDLIENRIVGIKSREVYEAPGAVILHTVHNELEKMILDREIYRFKSELSLKIANLIYDGKWYSELFQSLMSFVEYSQKYITGEITVELFKGSINILSRKSEYSLYDKNLATYTKEDTFNAKDAEGFIKLFGLQDEIRTAKYKNILESV